VRDAEELTAVLLSDWRPDKGRIEEFVAAHSNATDKTLAALPKLLRPS
jgi:3-deoxy-D-manno-octulosonic-acid transferase